MYDNKITIMINLGKTTMRVSINGNTKEVVSSFLRVFLANQRLTEKQLSVTTELVSKYAEYIYNGVKEPYASQLLFSTDTRKGICADLKISPAHLNNTFNALTTKNIVAKEENKYVMNPSIIPTQKLTFNFIIEDGNKPRQIRTEDIQGIRDTKEDSGADSKEPVQISKEVDDVKDVVPVSVHKESGMVHFEGYEEVT